MVSSAGCGGGIVCVPAGANLAGTWTKHVFRLRRFVLKSIVYQDRLGTNIRQALKMTGGACCLAQRTRRTTTSCCVSPLPRRSICASGEDSRPPRHTHKLSALPPSFFWTWLFLLLPGLLLSYLLVFLPCCLLASCLLLPCHRRACLVYSIYLLCLLLSGTMRLLLLTAASGRVISTPWS